MAKSLGHSRSKVNALNVAYNAVENIPIYLEFRYIENYIGIMKHRHEGGPDRHESSDHHRSRRCRHRSHEGHGSMHHRHERRGRHGKRLFDYGELRLLILALIADKPSHGYELIKDIEERFGGVYVPSPGVIYPTLSWLEDMGYAAVAAEAGGRKRFSITDEGAAFLVANRQSADSLLERIGSGGREGGRQHLPEEVLVAMKGFKHALRGRLDKGPIEAEEAASIVAALEAARRIVEQDK